MTTANPQPHTPMQQIQAFIAYSNTDAALWYTKLFQEGWRHKIESVGPALYESKFTIDDFFPTQEHSEWKEIFREGLRTVAQKTVERLRVAHEDPYEHNRIYDEYYALILYMKGLLRMARLSLEDIGTNEKELKAIGRNACRGLLKRANDNSLSIYTRDGYKDFFAACSQHKVSLKSIGVNKAEVEYERSIRRYSDTEHLDFRDVKAYLAQHPEVKLKPHPGPYGRTAYHLHDGEKYVRMSR